MNRTNDGAARCAASTCRAGRDASAGREHVLDVHRAHHEHQQVESRRMP